MHFKSQIVLSSFIICSGFVSEAVFADSMDYYHLDVGAFGAGGQRWTEHHSVDGVDTAEAKSSAEGGGRLAIEAFAYEPEEAFVMLWEFRMAAMPLGGSDMNKGYGGVELRGNGDIGMTFFALIPVNQAIEDVKLRITDQGVEGKVLIGTANVLPLDRYFDLDLDRSAFYLSVSHGMRYHSENNGWVWAVMPKLCFDAEWFRVEAKYLFGLWKRDRREHTGALALDVHVIRNLRVGLQGETEYLQYSRHRGELFGWRGMLSLSASWGESGSGLL